IMVLSHEDDEDDGHQYWYARVVGVFHVHVIHKGPGSKSSEPQRMDFLWVRWFGRDLSYRAGWDARRLHRIGFIPCDDPELEAFGFVNPSDVVRAVHLIPAFHHKRTADLLPGRSIARQVEEFSVSRREKELTDWRFFYVDMFVDRDMTMRYLGGGVGH
ncbi:hypothetical protein BV25DRAFT_1768684, partial [Artomyces pyxidatus]